MDKNWSDFKSMHSNVEGARSAFEIACESLFRKQYSELNVQQVAVKQGDGGIDIFIGSISDEPIKVIQCKFFLDELGDSQKQQITKSFKKAATSQNYKLKDWSLCIPRTLNLEEHKWWSSWATAQAEKFKIEVNSIILISGNDLIDRMKECDVYNTVFKIAETKAILETNENVKTIIDILEKKKDKSSHLQANDITNDVLFYNYTTSVEKYYLERSVDVQFCQKLSASHLWVSGVSGSGKTVFINRNLIFNSKNYLFCDLSPILISSVDDIFAEIYFELCEYLGIVAETPCNFIKQITKLLLLINNSFVIVVDELSIPNDQVLVALTDTIVRLINFYSNKVNSRELRFIISTIKPPYTSVYNKNKTAEYFEFVNSDDWEADLGNLFDLLNENLKTDINEIDKNFILQNSKSSPRLLKSIFKKLITSDLDSQESLKELVLKANQEYI